MTTSNNNNIFFSVLNLPDPPNWPDQPPEFNFDGPNLEERLRFELNFLRYVSRVGEDPVDFARLAAAVDPRITTEGIHALYRRAERRLRQMQNPEPTVFSMQDILAVLDENN